MSVESRLEKTVSWIQTGALEEILVDCALRAEIIAAIGSMDNYELTIAEAYVKRLLKARGKR